jgi:hypothetical protein
VYWSRSHNTPLLRPLNVRLRMRGWLLLAAALLIPIGLATTAFWDATEWVAPVHVESVSAESTLVVARPARAAQAPPTLAPAQGAVAAAQVPTERVSPTAANTPAPLATPTAGVVADPTPAPVSLPLAASGSVSPNQVEQPPAQADTSTRIVAPAAITNRPSSPPVREPQPATARGKPLPKAEHAPPGQLKNKPNAKRQN